MRAISIICADRAVSDSKRRNRFALVALLTPVLLSFAAASAPQANAQGSITIKKDALEPATWPKARREYQIIDDRPRVVDTRQPDPAPSNLIINIPPMAKAPGQQASGNGVNVVGRDLPNSGFYTNIPAKGMVPASASNLQFAKSGGLSPVDKQPRPVGMPTAHKDVSAQRQVAQQAAQYPTAPARGAAGYLGGESHAEREVRYKLLTDPYAHTH